MGAKLQALHRLQDLESQIVDIQRQIARAQRKVTAQQKRLKATRDRLEAERQQVQRDQMKVDELDLDIKGRTNNTERLREHLNTVRTNKEYAVILAKMNNEKADTTRIETQALDLMEEIEAKRKLLTEGEQAEQIEIDRLVELEEQLEASHRSYKDRLAELEQQKTAALGELPRETATLFDRLSQRYDGEALAEVVRPNPRLDEFVCGGCHMSLQPEVGNALRISDEVVNCRSCGRILHMPPQT